MAIVFTPYTHTDRTTANSYATVLEFETYLENRLNAPTIATDPEKQLLLIEGTRRLEAEDYNGYRTYTDGILKFPRTGIPNDDGFEFADDTVPDKVKKALFETAIYVKDVDLSVVEDTINFKSAKVGELEVEYKGKTLSPNDLNSTIWAYLAHFLTYYTNRNRISR